VSVEWSGPNRAGDYVTVVNAGAGISAYLSYQDTGRGNPAMLTLPAEPGDYEIRYVLGRPQRVLAAVPFKASDVTAELVVPPTGLAGSTIELAWTGPNYASDWITVVTADAPETSYNDYINANSGDRDLKLPVEPGDYEIRYVQNGRKILARASIVVTTTAAEITAAASGTAGASFKIGWTGPNDRSDWITVVTPDAPQTSYNDYIDASSGDRELELPVEPGDYEIRYVQNGRKILARAPIVVAPATAEITAPASVAAGASFKISWTGPNNRGDWLTIVAPDAAATSYASYVDADRGNPATLQAPPAAGTYELRYVLKNKKVIATRPIVVTGP
jgi:Ca-activated chloride channel family protein